MFLTCLNDQDRKVRYTAATSFAAYLKHNCENTQLLIIYQDCLPYFISVCLDYFSFFFSNNHRVNWLEEIFELKDKISNFEFI